jgi:hypothetical protein
MGTSGSKINELFISMVTTPESTLAGKLLSGSEDDFAE